MFGDPPKQLPQHFAVIVVPEFTMMPVTSAIEPLRLANRMAEKSLYKWTMHSVDGQPVAGASVTATYVAGTAYPVGTEVNTATSLADGTFKVWALLPGTYDLAVSYIDPATSATKTATVAGLAVGAGQNIDAGTAALQ